MKTKYVVANNELALVMKDNYLPCALKLDMVDESICIIPVIVDIDVPGWTIFNTEKKVIYWAIPYMIASDANILLDHITPLADMIISQYGMDIDGNAEPNITSSQIAIVQISQYINALEFLEAQSDTAEKVSGNRYRNVDVSLADCFVHRN